MELHVTFAAPHEQESLRPLLPVLYVMDCGGRHAYYPLLAATLLGFTDLNIKILQQSV